MRSAEAHFSTAHQAFFSIDKGEFREKIRFVQKYRETVYRLPLTEFVEIMDAYAEALFETGRFERHIRVADELIELAIMQNIGAVRGRDLYFETLFQKAASLYNLDRIAEAIHILQELLRINAKHESTRLFLINCHVRVQNEVHKRIRKYCMFGILASAAIIAVELLVVRPFIPEFTSPVEFSRNALFITSVSALVAGELWVRYRAVSRMYKHVHQ